MPTLDEFVNKVTSDPDLSPEDKQDLIFRAVVNREKNKTTQAQIPNMQPESLGQGLANTYNNTNAGFGEKLGDRINGVIAGAPAGAASGAAYGSIAGPPGTTAGAIGGGILGGLGGGIFPPHNLGDLATMAAAPLVGEGVGPLINKLPAAAKPVASGLSGILSMLGLSSLGEGVNRLGTSAGIQNVPQQNPIPQGKIPYIAAGAPPMLGQMLLRNMTKDRPFTKSFEFAQENVPQVKNIEDFKKLNKLSQITPQAEEILNTAKNPTDEEGAFSNIRKNLLEQLRSKKAAAQAAQKEIALNNEAKAKFDLQNSKVEILRKEQEAALNDPFKFNSPQQVEEGTANLKGLETVPGQTKLLKASATAQNRSIQTGNVDLEKDISGLQQTLADLKEKSKSLAPMNAGLRSITDNSKDVTEMLQNLQKATPEAVSQFRDHINSQPNSSRNLADFEKMMSLNLVKSAYDQKTGNLNNAPALFTEGGAFSPDKMRAIFGNDKTANDKIEGMQNFVNGVMASKNKMSMMANLGRYTAMHLIWVLPNMIVFHPETLTSTLPATGVLGGTALLGASYPKLIDGILKTPKLGDSFYKWATSTDSVGRSLSSWPRLAAWLKSNSEKIDTSKIEDKLSY